LSPPGSTAQPDGTLAPERDLAASSLDNARSRDGTLYGYRV
jgi:hypothetical protein